MASLFRKLPIQNFSHCIIRNKAVSRKKRPSYYMIVRPIPDEFDEIIELMHRSYYREEPLTSSISFKPTIFFDQLTLQTLHQGFSLVAKCKCTGDILGAAVNEVTHWWNPDLTDKFACKVNDVRSRQLLHFYAHTQRLPDLWKKYDVHKIFEICYLFVRRDQRKKGMGSHLLRESRKLAADCGLNLVRMDATSQLSASMAEKMKMKLVDEIPYCSYIGADQRPIFNPPAPNKSVKIYVDDEPAKNCRK